MGASGNLLFLATLPTNLHAKWIKLRVFTRDGLFPENPHRYPQACCQPWSQRGDTTALAG